MPIIPWARRDIHIQKPMMRTQGSSVMTIWTANGCCWLDTVMDTPLSRSIGNSAVSLGGTLAWKVFSVRLSAVSGFFSVASSASPRKTTDCTFPCSIQP